MSETGGVRGIPEIAICDGCKRGGMLGRINGENQLFTEAIEEATNFADMQQKLIEGAVAAGDNDRAALHQQLRDEHIANVAGQVSNVQGEISRVSRLNAMVCATVVDISVECSRYMGYAAEKGGVNIEILKAEEREGKS